MRATQIGQTVKTQPSYGSGNGFDSNICYQLHIIPTQQINDPVIDLEAECMPFLRTALLMGTGTKGLRVADPDAANEVYEANEQLINGAIEAKPYIPITAPIEFQELTDGTVNKAQEYLMSMQAIDNFRLGLHGVDNGGLFEKKSKNSSYGKRILSNLVC